MYKIVGRSNACTAPCSTPKKLLVLKLETRDEIACLNVVKTPHAQDLEQLLIDVREHRIVHENLVGVLYTRSPAHQEKTANIDVP